MRMWHYTGKGRTRPNLQLSCDGWMDSLNVCLGGLWVFWHSPLAMCRYVCRLSYVLCSIWYSFIHAPFFLILMSCISLCRLLKHAGVLEFCFFLCQSLSFCLSLLLFHIGISLSICLSSCLSFLHQFTCVQSTSLHLSSIVRIYLHLSIYLSPSNPSVHSPICQCSRLFAARFMTFPHC